MKMTWFRFRFIAVGVLLTATTSVTAQEPVPQEALKRMSFLVGTWETVGEMNGDKIMGKYSAVWGPGKNCLILNDEYGDLKGTGICGWNPRTKEIVETWYRSDGLSVQLRYSDFSENKWQGTAMLINSSGKRSAGNISVTIDGKGKFTFVGDAGDEKLTTINTKTE